MSDHGTDAPPIDTAKFRSHCQDWLGFNEYAVLVGDTAKGQREARARDVRAAAEVTVIWPGAATSTSRASSRRDAP